MDERVVTAQIVLVVLLIGSLVFLAVNKNFRISITVSFADPKPPPTPASYLLKSGQPQIFSSKKDLRFVSHRSRMEASRLLRENFHFPGGAPPLHLVDFCPQRAAIPVAFLKTGAHVAAFSTRRHDLQRLFDLSKALKAVPHGRLDLFWNSLASPSAEDHDLSLGSTTRAPAVNLNDLLNQFHNRSTLALRLCLRQLDSFVFLNSDAFFQRFQVPLIIVEDSSPPQGTTEESIASELRHRTFSSVTRDFSQRKLLPFTSKGERIAASAAVHWPSIVFWRRESEK